MYHVEIIFTFFISLLKLCDIRNNYFIISLQFLNENLKTVPQLVSICKSTYTSISHHFCTKTICSSEQWKFILVVNGVPGHANLMYV